MTPGCVYRVATMPEDILSTPLPWMVGRKIVVHRIVTNAQMRRETGHVDVADSDDCLRRGKAMPDLEARKRSRNDVAYIEVSVMARGMPKRFLLSPGEWCDAASKANP